MQDRLTGSFEEKCALLDSTLRTSESFDMTRYDLMLGGKTRAALYYIDTFTKDTAAQRLFDYWIKTQIDLTVISDGADFIAHHVPYIEATSTDKMSDIIYMVMSGCLLFIADGLDDPIIVDTRTYPARGVGEPMNDRVLRGSHDGFVETAVFNDAMIRRRIRDPRLTMSLMSIGGYTKTDVIVTYIEGRADPGFVEKVKTRLKDIEIKAINLGLESIAECLVKRRWYNPFPKVRYTERPDAAAAMLLEGSVIIICDNYPSVMILPTSIFDFIQETEDYYFPPIVGSYLRITRLVTFMATLFLLPVWYTLVSHPQMIPSWLDFIRIEEPGKLSLIAQLFLIEFAIDALKLASLNTPSMLGNSLSVVGGLILGDFAVQIGWFVPEAIVYMAFVAMSNFTQSSFELGYAFKFMRMLMLLTSWLLGVPGLVIGVLLVIVFVVTNKSVCDTRRYLYPLIPFNANALRRLFLRVKLK